MTLCLMFFSFSATAYDFKYPLSTVEMSLKKVSEHVYYVEGIPGVATDNQGFISNSSFIITEKGIVVIDALGSPSLAEQMMALIRTVSDKPIIEVITTHYHADHIYGLQVFKEQGAKVVAPLGADRYLDSEAAEARLEERRFSLEPWVNEKTQLIYPDELIKASHDRDYGDLVLTINYLGKAHSDGDLTVYVNSDGVLLSGDTIFEGRIPYLGDSDTKAWLNTLNKMLKNDNIKALIPGHGSYSNDAKKTISLTYSYLKFMREKFAEGVDELLTFDEIYSEIDWTEFEKLPAFDLGNRPNAYQVFLALEKELLEQ